MFSWLIKLSCGEFKSLKAISTIFKHEILLKPKLTVGNNYTLIRKLHWISSTSRQWVSPQALVLHGKVTTFTGTAESFKQNGVLHYCSRHSLCHNLSAPKFERQSFIWELKQRVPKFNLKVYKIQINYNRGRKKNSFARTIEWIFMAAKQKIQQTNQTQFCRKLYCDWLKRSLVKLKFITAHLIEKIATPHALQNLRVTFPWSSRGWNAVYFANSSCQINVWFKAKYFRNVLCMRKYFYISSNSAVREIVTFLEPIYLCRKFTSHCKHESWNLC